jgi:GntR family transcriptional regulator / MocR family aminotransferase
MLRSNTVSAFWTTFGVDLHLELDSAGGRRTGLERALREAIRTGRLGPRTRLPSTRALAAQVGLSRGTVTAAYDQLTAEGYLVARRGSGTEVAALAAHPAAASSGTRSDPPPPRHDLRPGSPDVTAFPRAAWLHALRRALAQAPPDAYGYGDPRGRVELRTALAGYLGRTRGVAATPDRIVITSGYVPALALLVRVLRAVGAGPVAMEDPGLPLHREVVRRAGADVLALPVDERGARTDLLPAAGAVVVTPAHQYPTGVSLHPRRRHELAGWAQDCGALVIEDDYDGEFRYDRQPVGALQGTAPDHVAYLGTASKTLAPALRLGWMVLPEPLVAPVLAARLHTGQPTETLGQLALAELIASHAYDRHIRACRLRYRRRRDLLLARLRPGQARHGFRVQGVAAGLHALVTLPEGGAGEPEVRARAAVRGLALEYLDEHWHAAGAHPQGVIVGYGTPSQSGYPAALDALARVLTPERDR